VVHHSRRIVADTKRPLVLYESGFAPRWYVPRDDVHESALSLVDHRTFCPYKGLCSYYDIGEAHLAVDRALRFYVDHVGFRLDVDYSPNDVFRVVQLSPLVQVAQFK
jgi:uncharacterized protein (DUF427 family)